MRKPSLWSIRQPIPRATALGLTFVMPVVVLAGWCIITYANIVPRDFVPTPTETIRGTLQLFLQYDLWTAILVSTRRIVLAFLLAAALACALVARFECDVQGRDIEVRQVDRHLCAAVFRDDPTDGLH